MPFPEPLAVRPTKRCLDDLHLSFPSLRQLLHTVDHPVIVRAQQVPREVEASGAVRIVAIRDRVWFKVKTGVYRAAVHRLSASDDQPQLIIDAEAWWWVGAAGVRRADSGIDFYSSLEAECRRAGKGTGSVDSTHLLPVNVDLRRLSAELATQWIVGVGEMVCRLVAGSIRDGAVWSARLRDHEVSAVVRARDGEAYLAIGAQGFFDPQLIAVILGSVPGVDPKAWLPEPDGCLGIEPGPGQILYSTMIPAEVQAHLVVEFGDED